MPRESGFTLQARGGCVQSRANSLREEKGEHIVLGTRRLALVIVATAVLCAPASASAAAGRDHGPIKGIVPSRNWHSSHGHHGGSTSSSLLIYHGGQVLAGNTVYVIFWSPSNYPIPSSYESLIDRFYTDVAEATTAGSSSNVYYSDTQYGAGISGSTAVQPGSLSNSSTFGGAYVDVNPISNGCKDHATSICVSDSQIVSEINKDLAPAGWSAGTGKVFFMFTPKGVGSCYSRGSCSFTKWCAYHSNSGSLAYANVAYADTVASACDAGYHPNASIDPDADATINIASHEHNEMITDPFGSAWYNSSGYENGDLCAWNFGTMLGGSGSSSYNQLINGDRYALQQEWSNDSSGCVLTGI